MILMLKHKGRRSLLGVFVVAILALSVVYLTDVQLWVRGIFQTRDNNCSGNDYGIKLPLKIVYTEVLKETHCDAKFCDTMEGNQRKIASYNFTLAKPYLHHLEPKAQLTSIFKGTNSSDTEVPVLVSAASSNHFKEIVEMLKNLNSVLRPAYPTTKLYLYDLGLSQEEIKQLKSICNCSMVTFPFEKYPPHVRQLFGYCWKPLIIKMMLQTYRFVMWMDSSIRFKTSQLDPLFINAKQQGILSNNDGHILPAHIHEDTFIFLEEPPCLYRDATEYQGTLLLFHSDKSVINDYVIAPWISCALIEDCMKTKVNITKAITCHSHTLYHSCHRYDQAILGLLLYRLFHNSYMDFHIDLKYFDIIRVPS